MALVTSKTSDVAWRNAQSIGLAAYLDRVVGSDHVKKYKPDPEGIFSALDLFGLAQADWHRAIMIGDARSDIEMGQAAGIDTCAVGWGAHGAQTLRAARPTWMAESFAALLEMLNRAT